MNRALAATLVMLFNSVVVNAAGAQTYEAEAEPQGSMVEQNARDAICEWSYKGQSGIEKCHIIAMGTHGTGGDEVMVFKMDGKTFAMSIEGGKRIAQIGSGGFWNFKEEWHGTFREWFKMLSNESMTAKTTYKLSNGYTIKLVY